MRYLVAAIPAVIAMLFVAGCGGAEAKVHGKAIPDDLVMTLIKNLADDPGTFDGRLVLVSGVVSSECPSGCWFWLKDATGEIYVTTHAANFAIPQHVKGNATVYGRVLLQDGRAQLLGLGIQLH